MCSFYVLLKLSRFFIMWGDLEHKWQSDRIDVWFNPSTSSLSLSNVFLNVPADI